MAARSNAWVYGRSLAGTAGSNPAGGTDVSLDALVCCQMSLRRLITRPEESYRVRVRACEPN